MHDKIDVYEATGLRRYKLSIVHLIVAADTILTALLVGRMGANIVLEAIRSADRSVGERNELPYK